MSATESITFVVSVNDSGIFENNFLASPALQDLSDYQLFVQEKFSSAAQAYNDAIERSANDLIVCAHQDIFLPRAWLSQVQKVVSHLDRFDSAWGVLGCWGVTRDGRYIGYIYSTGLGVIGHAFEHPQTVQTLDEIVLIFRKSSGLRFNETLGGFHFYGADICMTAFKQGRTSYAMSAFCIHNTKQLLVLPSEFFHCYKRFRKTWKSYLPVQTTCIRVSKLGLEPYIRKLRELRSGLGLGNTKRPAALRVARPDQLLADLKI